MWVSVLCGLLRVTRISPTEVGLDMRLYGLAALPGPAGRRSGPRHLQPEPRALVWRNFREALNVWSKLDV
jgi:hypothetical protein